MHFDEVYHARTATEFLQHWKYGEPHGIYEYTHPHLAKYAMAKGIDLFADNRVVARSDLGTPVRDVALEPRWDEPFAAAEDPEALTSGGDRLYVATGDALDVYDLKTRALLARFPMPGAQAVAVDTDTHQAYVGTATGEVLVMDTAVPAADLGAADGSGPDGAGRRRSPTRAPPATSPWSACGPPGPATTSSRGCPTTSW